MSVPKARGLLCMTTLAVALTGCAPADGETAGQDQESEDGCAEVESTDTELVRKIGGRDWPDPPLRTRAATLNDLPPIVRHDYSSPVRPDAPHPQPTTARGRRMQRAQQERDEAAAAQRERDAELPSLVERRALLLTEYRECFSPSDVVAAEQYLRALD